LFIKNPLSARKSSFRFITGVDAVMRFASANVSLYLQKSVARGETDPASIEVPYRMPGIVGILFVTQISGIVF
jgi:hypothetical protein